MHQDIYWADNLRISSEKMQWWTIFAGKKIQFEDETGVPMSRKQDLKVTMGKNTQELKDMEAQMTLASENAQANVDYMKIQSLMESRLDPFLDLCL